MKLGYYNPQLKVKQIKTGSKIIGYLILTHHAYGYTVQFHKFDTPGYIVNQTFPTQEKAELFFNKVYEKEGVHNDR